MDKKLALKILTESIEKLTISHDYQNEADLAAGLLKANGEARGMLIWLRREIGKCTQIS